MTDRLKKEDFVRLLAARMNADEATATAWVDGVVETLYESFKDGKGVTLPVLAASTCARSLKAGSSSSIQVSDCARFLAGHRPTQEHSRRACTDKEELDATGNQSVGDVPTQNIDGFSPRSAENGSHHKGE